MLLAQANSTFNVLALAAGWVILIFVTLLGAAIVWAMFTGVIDLTKVISEPNGDASMSRLQLLIFTFVIAVSLFLVIIYNHGFPPITQGILVLLGISSSSYLVSKGIQFSSEAGVVEGVPSITIAPVRATVTADGKSTVSFTVKTVKVSDKVNWTLNPPSPAGGTIDANGKYTAPAAIPQSTPGPATPRTDAFVEVHATSADDPSVVDASIVHLTS